MLIAEAEWIGAALDALPEDAFPLAHIGCQTDDFRTRVQPWVDAKVFAPLLERKAEVVHVDIRDEPGVDVVADVTSPDGQAAIRRTGARTLLCANLLEHVEEPREVLAGLVAGVPIGGYLILTGPRDFPYHPDPIDTMFRPSWRDMAAMLGADFDVVSGGEIVCRPLGYYLGLRKFGRVRHVLRLAAPFHKSTHWLDLVKWVGRPTKAYALVARRTR